MLHALITKDFQEVKIHQVIQNTPQLKTLSPAKARKTFKAISFCAHISLSKEHTNLNDQNYFFQLIFLSMKLLYRCIACRT